MKEYIVVLKIKSKKDILEVLDDVTNRVNRGVPDADSDLDIEIENIGVSHNEVKYED